MSSSATEAGVARRLFSCSCRPRRPAKLRLEAPSTSRKMLGVRGRWGTAALVLVELLLDKDLDPILNGKKGLSEPKPSLLMGEALPGTSSGCTVCRLRIRCVSSSSELCPGCQASSSSLYDRFRDSAGSCTFTACGLSFSRPDSPRMLKSACNAGVDFCMSPRSMRFFSTGLRALSGFVEVGFRGCWVSFSLPCSERCSGSRLLKATDRGSDGRLGSICGVDTSKTCGVACGSARWSCTLKTVCSPESCRSTKLRLKSNSAGRDGSPKV